MVQNLQIKGANRWIRLNDLEDDLIIEILSQSRQCSSFSAPRGGQGGKIVNFEFHYRVVRFHYQRGHPWKGKTSTMFIVTRTSLEWQNVSRWRHTILRLDSGFNLSCWVESKDLLLITAYNGKLHWVSLCGRYLVTYDPFNMGQTSFTDGPSFNSPELVSEWFCRFHVGESEGVLRVMRTRIQRCVVSGVGDLFSRYLSVGNLESDDNGKRLSFTHNAAFRTISNNPCLRETVFPRVGELAFHPRNKDVVYLLYLDSASKELSLVQHEERSAQT